MRATLRLAPAILALIAAPAAAQDLPDWSGVWELVGGTLYDRATADPVRQGHLVR